MSSARLRLWRDTAAARPRGPQADPWLTLAGWLWTAYFVGIAAGAVWLAS